MVLPKKKKKKTRKKKILLWNIMLNSLACDEANSHAEKLPRWYEYERSYSLKKKKNLTTSTETFYLLFVLVWSSFHHLNSFQFAEEFHQSLVKLSGLVLVADVTSSFQLQHRVIGKLYQVLVGLRPKVCIQGSVHDQSGSLERGVRRRWTNPIKQTQITYGNKKIN